MVEILARASEQVSRLWSQVDPNSLGAVETISAFMRDAKLMAAPDQELRRACGTFAVPFWNGWSDRPGED